MAATLTITELVNKKDTDKILFRVDLNTARGKPMLSRRFTQEHIALGLAIAAGRELGIEPDLTVRRGVDDGAE